MNDILDKITNVLKKYLDTNKYDFFLYGSRAKGDFFSGQIMIFEFYEKKKFLIK